METPVAGDDRGLPGIAPYPLPAADDVPAGSVDWRVDPSRAALLVHDLQVYFGRPFSGDRPLGQMLANVARLAAACRQADVPVFYTAQVPHQDPRDRGLQREIWGPGMGADPTDAEILPDVAPRFGDLVLEKWRYSAFQRTNLEPLLLARGRDQIIVTGIYAHIGCMLTAADAFMRDIRPFFVADGTADFSRAHHDMALEYVAGRCGRVVTTDELLEAL